MLMPPLQCSQPMLDHLPEMLEVDLVWSGVGKDEYAFQPGSLDRNNRPFEVFPKLAGLAIDTHFQDDSHGI